MVLDMEIKTPQELSLTQEKGSAWLEKTPKSPSGKPPLGFSVRDTPGQEGSQTKIPDPRIPDPPTIQGHSQD